MHEKNIKRIVREQLKKKHPNWRRLAKKQKKQFAREVTDAVIAEYVIYNQELDVPIENLIGIEEQQVDRKIIPLQDMADFFDNFHQKSGVIDFAKYRKPWPEIHNKELQFIDKLFDDRILNSLLSYEGYSPQMRDIFPCQLFRAELMKALKYPEISYRKYCNEEYMGQERKENRRFLGLPLNTKNMIDHTNLCHFRKSLSFTQQVNVLIYILHYFHRSGLLQDSVIHGVDSTEIACDSKMPLYVVEVGDKKVRIYNDIDCDCGVRRHKRDKSKFVIGYLSWTSAHGTRGCSMDDLAQTGGSGLFYCFSVHK